MAPGGGDVVVFGEVEPVEVLGVVVDEVLGDEFFYHVAFGLVFVLEEEPLVVGGVVVDVAQLVEDDTGPLFLV